MSSSTTKGRCTLLAATSAQAERAELRANYVFQRVLKAWACDRLAATTQSSEGTETKKAA
ncbi:MAG: hypothetical protein QGI78_01375 [Phycisphaerales bacterium]|nr:hypothetical protein [Phycisphaerales bacterium]